MAQVPRRSVKILILGRDLETGEEEKPTPRGFLDLMVSGLQPTGTSEELLERTQNCLPKRRKGRL